MRRRSTPSLILAALVLALIPAAPSEAQIIGLTEYAVDFTNAKEAVLKTRWDDTDLFRLSERGFGRIDNPAGTREVTLRTSEPIALGTWWRPTGNASIQTVVTWAGEHAGEMPGDMHVSYSCDASSWSDWQLVPETRAGKTKTTRVHNTVLQVPRQVRQWYWEALARWGKHEEGVAWDGDEEAFVTWHRERHPTAFTRTRPFIGYVRFMYETEVPHGTYITGFDIDVTWVVSGISSVPSKEVEAIQEKRRGEPWRWRADAAPDNAEDDGQLRADVTSVYSAAIRYLMAKAAESKDSGERPAFERVILHPYSVGGSEILTLPHTQFRAFWQNLQALDRTLVRSFRDRCMRYERLPHVLDPGTHVIYVSPRRWRSLRDERGRHDWQQHYKRWPRSFGRIYVSGIGFSEDGTQALVHVGREYGYLAGYGRLVQLAKKNGRWVVTQVTPTWVS